MENRRKTIVINRKFQYQYSLLCAAVSVLLVNGFLLVRMLFPGDDPLALSMTAALAIGAVELILIVSIWFFVLRTTHRIAGPVHVINREIARLGAGDLTANIALRETDMFQEEAAQMNASIVSLREQIETLKAMAARIEDTQVADQNLAAVIASLQSELARLNTDVQRDRS